MKIVDKVCLINSKRRLYWVVVVGQTLFYILYVLTRIFELSI